MALKLKKVDYVMLFVSNMEKSLAFYRDRLGLEVGFHEANWAELKTEGFTLALHFNDKPEPLLQMHQLPCVIFASSDIQADREQLLKMDIAAGPIVKVSEYGDTVGVSSDFRDPDGNSLSLFANLSRSQWEALNA